MSSIDDRLETFRLALQELWSEDFPILLKANIDPDNRTIFLVIRVGAILYSVEFGLPVPEDFPNRPEFFDLEADEVGTDDDGPSIEPITSIAEAIEGTRSWYEAIQEAADPLKSYWTQMRTRVLAMFPAREEYFTSLQEYLTKSFNQDPSVAPPQLVDIYTLKTNKRVLAIIITEAGVTYRVDYTLPVFGEYPAQLFPGKEKGIMLGAEGPSRVVTQLPFVAEGYHPWSQEITRIEATQGSNARARLSKALHRFWQESIHNIFVVLRRSGIAPHRSTEVATGSEPGLSGLKSKSQRHRTRRAVSEGARKRHMKRSHRLTQPRGTGWIRPKGPKDPMDPRTASSEIGDRRPKPYRI